MGVQTVVHPCVSLGDCPRLCLELSSDNWLALYFVLLEQPAGSEKGVYWQLHCLRLMQCILSAWGVEEEPRMAALVRQLFATLGRIALHCPGDATLQSHPQSTSSGGCNKARVLLTASHSGSVAEELVALLRRLHTLPHWNAVINSFLAQKLCVAAELLQGESREMPLDTEHGFVLGVLSAMGGYDLRPRVGLHCFHEGSHMIIASFTQKGRCLLAHSCPGTGATVGIIKVPLAAVLPQLDHSVFSLSRLPMNEMLLNAWTVLLYGGAANGSGGSSWELLNASEGRLDVHLLRSQQLQLAVLHTNGVLYRHQAALRKILKQRAPAGSGGFLTSEGSEQEQETEAEQEPEAVAKLGVVGEAQTEAELHLQPMNTNGNG